LASNLARFPALTPDHPRRRSRLLRQLRIRLQGLLSEGDLMAAISEGHNTSFETLERWVYRSLFHSSWSAIKDNAPIEGVALVPFDSLIASAIASPLGMWCLRAEYKSKGDAEWDTNIVSFEAPWFRDCPRLLGDVVSELQQHGNALMCCESEWLAKGLQLASRFKGSRSRRLWVSLYNDRGLRVAGG
jgi:hypothetical protein